MSEHREPGAGLLALKQAKVALVSQRAALRQAERQQADEATLATLRQGLADAEQQLHRAEDASGKPAPQLQRIDKRPISAELRALKTELAYARADLKKLERNAASEAQLQTARERLRAAEQALETPPAE
ncbi:MAG: hypothetical protein GAK43_01002 [Stenotrophomonas maltophilia]|nr:MAG: hypothetical protein GAK43_01002 [Stenotrophomonas maltophilia]